MPRIEVRLDAHFSMCYYLCTLDMIVLAAVAEVRQEYHWDSRRGTHSCEIGSVQEPGPIRKPHRNHWKEECKFSGSGIRLPRGGRRTQLTKSREEVGLWQAPTWAHSTKTTHGYPGITTAVL